MKSLFFFTAIILVFFSCRKDEIELQPQPPAPPCDTTFIEVRNNDTIFPSEYLMTYPGSWWSYDNGSIEISFEWEEVPIYTRTNNEEGCLVITSTYVYVPRTTYGYIYKTNLIKNEEPYKTKVTQLVGEVGSTQTWSIWHEASDPQYSYEFIYTFESLNAIDTMTVNGTLYSDIIKVYQSWQWYYWADLGGPMNERYSYYAKDVGLIFVDDQPADWGVPEEYGLDNYLISP